MFYGVQYLAQPVTRSNKHSIHFILDAVQPTTTRHLWPRTPPYTWRHHQSQQDLTVWEGRGCFLVESCDAAAENISLLSLFWQHLFNAAAFKARTKQRNKVRDKRADVMWWRWRTVEGLFGLFWDGSIMMPSSLNCIRCTDSPKKKKKKFYTFLLCS